jgi:hypothetical protein
MSATAASAGDVFGDEQHARELREEEQPMCGLGCVLATLVAAIAALLASLGMVRLPVAAQKLLISLLVVGKVRHLPADQPDALTQLFFGGEPWLVHCSRSGLVGVSFMTVPKYLADVTSFAILDCDATASGETARERFKLGASGVFTVANGDSPRPVPAHALTSAYALAAHTRSAVALQIAEVTAAAQLVAYCHGRPCLVVAEASVSSAVVRAISARNRRLRIALVPASYELVHHAGALALALVRVDNGKGAAADGADASADGAAHPEPWGGWLEHVLDGDASDEAALGAFAASIPIDALESRLPWFGAAPSPPKVAARRRARRTAQRVDEASRREQMAREEAAYAKSLFAADNDDEDDD